MDVKLFVLFALLLVPLASAQDWGVSGRGLESAMADVQCKTDFTVAVVGSVKEKVPGITSLDGVVEAVQAGTSALRGYADANDTEGFRTYLKEGYAPALKGAREAVREARKEFRGLNVSVQTKKELLDEYKELKGTYSECHSGAVKKYAEAKLAKYDEAIAEYEERASKLAEKGVDTSDLSAILAEAKTSIVGPLRAAVGSAGTGEEAREALGKYCLFNGCKNGTNFHLAAKLGIEKLDAILAALKDKAEEAGLGAKVSEAQGRIDTAKARLDSVSSSKYSEEDRVTWDEMKAAAGLIKEILREVRSGGNAAEAGGNE